MSQAEITLQHIVKYGSITSKEGFALYAIARLSTIINNLKEIGFEFTTKTVDEGIIGKTGRKPVAYSLTEEQREHAADLFEYNRLYSKLKMDAK